MVWEVRTPRELGRPIEWARADNPTNGNQGILRKYLIAYRLGR
jgi:hypothetical protein